jgi:hypothetical protein
LDAFIPSQNTSFKWFASEIRRRRRRKEEEEEERAPGTYWTGGWDISLSTVTRLLEG